MKTPLCTSKCYMFYRTANPILYSSLKVAFSLWAMLNSPVQNWLILSHPRYEACQLHIFQEATVTGAQMTEESFLFRCSAFPYRTSWIVYLYKTKIWTSVKKLV